MCDLDPLSKIWSCFKTVVLEFSVKNKIVLKSDYNTFIAVHIQSHVSILLHIEVFKI